MKNILVLIIILFCYLPAYGDDGKWYQLENSQKYVADYQLESGEIKAITIPSNKEIVIGFLSNASFDQFEKYKSTNKNIQLMQRNEDRSRSVGSIYGAGTLFKPMNGKIDITVSNDLDEEMKIVIYIKE